MWDHWHDHAHQKHLNVVGLYRCLSRNQKATKCIVDFRNKELVILEDAFRTGSDVLKLMQLR